MAANPDDIYIEMELAGEGGGWTRINDVFDGVEFDYGIQSFSPTERVASTGTMSFWLNNGETNEGGVIGYYMPGHPDCRSGFDFGIGVRLAIEYNGTTYYKFRGLIDHIQPALVKGKRRVQVTVVDWMDEAARAKMKGLTVQTNIRSDQAFADILATVIRQPGDIELGVGMEQYAYAFDNTQDESVQVLEEITKLANSELGYVYVKGDTTQGGTLVFEDRRQRGVTSVSSATFTENDLHVIKTDRSRSDVINKAIVTVHPRRVDSAGTQVDPLTLTPTMWLDADALTGLSDGDAVTTWTDQSGNGRNLTASGTAKPLFKTNVLNGLPVLRFDGVNDKMTGSAALSALITNSAATIFTVSYFSSGTNGTVFSETSGNIIRQRYTSNAIFHNNDGSDDSASVTFSAGTWYIGTWMHSGGSIYGGLNDTRTASLTGTASGNTTPLTGFLKVGNTAADGQNLNGDIAEILVFNTALSEDDRKNIEGYLADKYAITIPYSTGSPTVVALFELPQDQTYLITQNTSITLNTPYKNPDEKKDRIGTAGAVDPVATTDYLFNTEADGGGLDVTAQLTVTPTFGGNSASVVIYNAGPRDGYVTFFQIRGRGVYDNEPIVLTAEDTTSQTTFGENVISMDMPYQSDPAIGQDAAAYLVQHSQTDLMTPTEISYIANRSDALLTNALELEISDRIDVTEASTSIDASFFINAIKGQIYGKLLQITYTLAPAGDENYWILEVDGFTELDETTRLAYGFFNRYWIMGIAALGSDTRVNP